MDVNGGWEVQTGFAAMVWDSLAAVSFSHALFPPLQVSQTFTHSKEKGENPVKAL